MAISVFDLFKIGIGPSSSHTVGPMRAARTFALGLEAEGLLPRVAAVRAELYGSLGATGRGHGSDKAVILGLLGETPEQVDVAAIPALLARVRAQGSLALLGHRAVPFLEREHLQFLRRSLPYHPNGLRFAACDEAGQELRARVYYSVGGGFVVDEQAAAGESPLRPDEQAVPHPFHSGQDLLDLTARHGRPISALMLENEQAWRPEAAVRAGDSAPVRAPAA